MGWEDRHYHREGYESPQNPLMRALWWCVTGSVHLYTAFGIRVAAHASLIILIAINLLLNFTQGYTWQDKVASMSLLFGIILLHEYGHCFGARAMGGSANNILMWPLGGLAYTDPPKRPWPTFVTVAAGPMVNVVLCGVALLFMLVTLDQVVGLSLGQLLNPFSFVIPIDVAVDATSLTFWTWYLFKLSWLLLLFNLLPIFPLDGGRMVQTILWPQVGYYKSMLFASATGMVGCVMLAVLGLVFVNLMLVLLGVLFFMQNRGQYQMIKAEGPWAFQDEDEPDYAASLRMEEDEPSWRQRWADRRAERRERQEEETARQRQQELDAVLAKVSTSGMESLTKAERRILARETDARRSR